MHDLIFIYVNFLVLVIEHSSGMHGRCEMKRHDGGFESCHICTWLGNIGEGWCVRHKHVVVIWIIDVTAVDY